MPPELTEGASVSLIDGATLARRYREVRRATERLCDPLVAEDYVLQSMPEASPVKWHLAHTSWFFETFVLDAAVPGYRPFHPEFRYLFNSYYEAVGPRWPRPRRGLLSRPTVEEVYQYRASVDEQTARVFRTASVAGLETLASVLVLGLQHEQQHQELILTDLKNAWAANPLRPVYRETTWARGALPPARWLSFPEGLSWIGHDGGAFAFDNESPRHRRIPARLPAGEPADDQCRLPGLHRRRRL